MKREQFIKQLKKLARKNGWELEIKTAAGKGSHYRVTLNGRKSTIQSGELAPFHVERIEKQLGVK